MTMKSGNNANLCITWNRSKNEQRECRWLDLLRNSSSQKSLFRSERSGDGHLDTGLLFVDLVEIIAHGQCEGQVPLKVKNESSLCSLRCLPPTGPGTRRSLWLWLRSRRPAARTIRSTGEELIGFDMISLIIEDVIGFEVLCLRFDIFRRCSSSSRTCVRKDLFCDGRINCALKTSKPPDETSCRWGFLVLVTLMKINCKIWVSCH